MQKTQEMCSIPGIQGLRRAPGEGNGNPLQYSYLENSMDRGAWWAIVHGVTKSRTKLSMHTYIYKYIHTYIHTYIYVFVYGSIILYLDFKAILCSSLNSLSL